MSWPLKRPGQCVMLIIGIPCLCLQPGYHKQPIIEINLVSSDGHFQ